MENQLTQDNIKKDAIPVEEAFSNMSPVKTGATATVPQPNPLDFTGMIQEQEQIAKDTGNARDSQLNSIASAFNRISGLPQAQLQMEQDAGIQNMQQDLQQYDSMIALKNRDYTNQYRALEERGSSLSSIRGRQNQLNTQATREMADLAIIRDSKAGRLDLAKQWVDKKIQAETAQARSQLEATQFFYNENKEVLTKAQDRAFSLKIADQEKKLADEKELRTAVNNIALQSAQYGATPDVVSQIGNAKTHKEAIALASKYLGEPFRLQVDMQEFNKRIQLEQLQLSKDKFSFDKRVAEAKDTTPNSSDMDKNADFKKLKGNSELKNALDEYKKVVKEQGARKETNPNASIIKEKYGAVLQAYRAAVDLGALQGADVGLVDDAIKKAIYQGAGIKNVVLFGIPNAIRKTKTRKGAELGIESAYETIENSNSRLEGIIKASNPDWVETPYYKEITGSSSDDTYLDSVDAVLNNSNNIYSEAGFILD